MWVAMNDSFVSIVQDNRDLNSVVVRARVEEDLENLFPEHSDEIVEMEDSDYRFRLFLDKVYVADQIRQRVLDIDYMNFKDSVEQSWRKIAYMKIWQIMYDVQQKIYENTPWWVNYRE